MEFTFYYKEYEVQCICKKLWNKYHKIWEADEMRCWFQGYIDGREPNDDDRKQCEEKAIEYIEGVWNNKGEMGVICGVLRDV